jgi:hypothetical protein
MSSNDGPQPSRSRKASRSTNSGDHLSILRSLVFLSNADPSFVDRYLHRAETLLAPICSRDHYRVLKARQIRLSEITTQLRQTVGRGDWTRVVSLAREGEEIRGYLSAESEVLPIAETVYGPRVRHFSAASLGLSGVVAQPDAILIRSRDEILARLDRLRTEDIDWAPFYHARAGHFGGVCVEGNGGPRPGRDDRELRQRILDAVDKGEFTRIKNLADTVAGQHSPLAGRSEQHFSGSAPPQMLTVPFPEAAVTRAHRLGLELATLPDAPRLEHYVHATERADPGEGQDACTCGQACPPAMRVGLRHNLDLLIGHAFISSAGTRYLPTFHTETLLIETFPESEPDARTDLLAELGLSRRRGLPRLAIEDALLTRGPTICSDIGLDPTDFALVCVPFDVYLRLAPDHGWGRQELWTHMDGYQVKRDLDLWALVGGNARFGGSHDLSSVARRYVSDHLTLRLAIVRRDRFLVR